MISWLHPSKGSRYSGPEIYKQVQSLRSNMRACPRGCGGKVLTGDQSAFNAKSKLDNKQICTSCAVKERINATLDTK